MSYYGIIYDDSYLAHHGIKGMKWGIRRYQNEDGSLTPEGKRKYYSADGKRLTGAGKRWQVREKSKYYKDRYKGAKASLKEAKKAYKSGDINWKQYKGKKRYYKEKKNNAYNDLSVMRLPFATSGQKLYYNNLDRNKKKLMAFGLGAQNAAVGYAINKAVTKGISTAVNKGANAYVNNQRQKQEYHDNLNSQGMGYGTYREVENQKRRR